MSQPPVPVWRLSPCTISFVSSYPTFEKAERFKFQSIYMRDDVSKKKKVFNDIEKPELLLQQFRREIDEANARRFRRRKPQKLKSLMHQKYHRNSESSIDKPSMASTITNRLYVKSPKQSRLYDFYGNRSHMAETMAQTRVSGFRDFKETETTPQKRRLSYIFTMAKRLDLSKPRNFFPGPGAYEHPLKLVVPAKLNLRTCTSVHQTPTENAIPEP